MSLDTPYLLAAAGVIVLLLVLLLALLLGRRRAETRQLDQIVRQPESLDEATATTHLSFTAESTRGPATAPPLDIALPAPPVEQVPPVEPSAAIRESQEWVVTPDDQPLSDMPVQPAGFRVPLHPSDPAITLVERLVEEGTGELTTAELRRLDLFRPERIIDASNHVAERLSGRNKESKRGRLIGIRQYAESLRAEFEFESPVLSRDFSDEAAGAPEEAALDVADTLKVPPPEAWGTSEGEPLPPDPELSLLHHEPPPAEAMMIEEPEAEEPVVMAPEHGERFDDVEESWEPLETPEPPIAAETPLAGDLEIETFALDAAVTAEDVAALPPAEQAGALSLLDSPQLGRLLSMGQPQELKRAVIDQLERAGDPAAMAALEVAFDDADPQIQLYALDAADRLLSQ
ncbi:MAG: hypothetical protein M5U22_15285 [Thermoleophilia bacterium]|nr:hypothetical protein [Thermoleophilia bacterium]